jgi:DNA polymerase I-like protein with 3'-5' exonuclease and polymerase domains
LFIPEPGAKWAKDAKVYRTLAKQVQFGSLYGAKTPTVHRLITETEVDKDDGMTELPFLRKSLREIREIHEKWLDAVPEFKKGWATAEEEFRKNGYVSSKILGRRRDFLDAGNPEDGKYNMSELANTCVQPTAADHINLASAEIYEQIKPNQWGPGTGMFCQVHDWVGIECPEDKADYVADVINRAMNKKYDQLPGVTLTASAEKGYSWDKC